MFTFSDALGNNFILLKQASGTNINTPAIMLIAQETHLRKKLLISKRILDKGIITHSHSPVIIFPEWNSFRFILFQIRGSQFASLRVEL